MNRVQTQRGTGFNSEPGETILEAGRRAGFGFPAACRNGVCERCQGRLVDGSVRILRKNRTIRAGEAGSEAVLYCVAVAETDCEIDVPDLTLPGEIPAREIHCQITSVEPLTHDISRVWLRQPAGTPVPWHAGQYLILQRNTPAAFSIANAPADGERKLELHVRHTDDNPASLEIIQALREDGSIDVSLPHGQRYLDQPLPQRPLWFICGSTGFAPAKAMLEYLAQRAFRHPVRVFFGARREQDLYLLDQLDQLKATLPDMDWLGILSHEQGPGRRTGLAHEPAVAALAEQSLAPEIHVGGSPTMAWAVFDALVAAGHPADLIHSDVFDYAPRNSNTD